MQQARLYHDSPRQPESCMPNVTLYHNPRCSKSRAALALLEAQGIQPAIRLYMDQPPSKTELRKLLRLLDMRARELLRDGEEAYKRLGLADPSLSEDQIIAAILAEPKLLQRPIIVVDDEAVVGRPPEKLLDLLP
jgi:arsenate reductase